MAVPTRLSASAGIDTAAVRAEHLGKRYALGEREQYKALRDLIAGGFRTAVRRPAATVGDPGHRWALDDVSFSVDRGEVVGLVGRNGAGKSTLLKLISRITRPTRGQVTVRGRVGTLLEVGSGFHPELTGAENIYLNGAILGMRRSEIRANFEQIVDFSGVSAYLDTPVKRYSTGMYMRLAFAVAAHLNTEVLLVDEVLAVGDAEFQRKCVGRMRELSESHGRTVLFVSHSDAAIRQLCPRSIWLHAGTIRRDGPSDEVLSEYLDEQFRDVQFEEWLEVTSATRRGSGEARFGEIRLEVPGRTRPRVINPEDPLSVRLRIEARQPVVCGNVAVYLSTLTGLKVLSAGTGPGDEPITLPQGTTEISIDIDAVHLNSGRYTLGLWLSRPTGARRRFGLYDSVEEVLDVVVAAPLDEHPPEGLVVARSSVTVTPVSGARP